ncbi:MAG: GUN4 domain-containing protein [Okeania sp. SIO2F4]|uniref:GUN4 domain-containing protein n=1 Tax=Okeania sp. SIO2F4 TaxID=2607790 RepID=UPI00142C66C7|nr:GUN4 domain-containing protein [Okeania sp. SIO2F4]NES02233.1 GUN4 domain-containing protein [Okeania sp. SIO2F4]
MPLFLGLGIIITLIFIVITNLVFSYDKSTEISPVKTPSLPLDTSITNIPITNLEEYTQLTYLLALKKWKEADLKTGELIRIRANRQREGFLNGESVRNFSCEDLQIIDNLWRKESDDRFGFSIQKQIWKNIAKNPESFDLKTYQKFLKYIGREKTADYNKVVFESQSPRGHLLHTGMTGIWARGEDAISLLLSCNFN